MIPSTISEQHLITTPIQLPRNWHHLKYPPPTTRHTTPSSPTNPHRPQSSTPPHLKFTTKQHKPIMAQPPPPSYTPTITAYITSPPPSRPSLITALTQPTTHLFESSGAAACESHLWAFWSAVLSTAISTPSTDLDTHNTLVTLVGDVKALGPLTRDTDGGKEVADTWGGRLWSDLPLLGASLREKWNDSPPAMSGEEWGNLNMFVARLTQTEVHDGAILGLWAIRDALEEKRPLNAREGSGDSNVSGGKVGLDELLPGALAWFEGAGEQISSMCKDGRSFAKGPQHGDPGACGELAKQGEVGAEEEGLAVGGLAGEGKMVGRVKEGGFNETRWRFWRARLRALSERRDEAGGRDKVAKVAYKGMDFVGRFDGKMGIQE